MRLLKYSNDSKTLLFTTTLQNNVQAYSLQQARLLDPYQEHPSPPTCIALSPSGHLLLSCSRIPPTIYLQNLTLRSPPLKLRPSASSAAVVTAAFHPERANIFCLGFEDGTVAAYDAARLFRERGKGERNEMAAGTGKGGQIGFIEKVHGISTGLKGFGPDESYPAAVDEGVELTPIGDISTSVRAVQLIPGSQAKAISVGTDGKCCLLDFENNGKKKGFLIRSWHLLGPATSLSLIPLTASPGYLSGVTKGKTKRGYERGPNSSSDAGQESGCLICVGRQDGKVVLFDAEGSPMGIRTFDKEGGQVVDVEWIQVSPRRNNNSSRSAEQEIKNAYSPKKSAQGKDKMRKSTKSVKGVELRRSLGGGKRKSLSSILAAGRDVQEEIVAVIDHTGSSPSKPSALSSGLFPSALPEDSLAPRSDNWQDIHHSCEPDFMNLFSPLKPATKHQPTNAYTVPMAKRRNSGTVREQDLINGIEGDAQSVISAPVLWDEKNVSSSHKNSQKVPFQGRVKARSSLVRKSKISRSSMGIKPVCPSPSTNEQALATLLDMRSKGAAKGLALFAPYMQKKNVSGSVILSKYDPTAPQRTNTVSKTSKDVDNAGTDLIKSQPASSAPKSSSKGLRRKKIVSFADSEEESEPNVLLQKSPRNFKVHKDKSQSPEQTQGPRISANNRPGTPRAKPLGKVEPDSNAKADDSTAKLDFDGAEEGYDSKMSPARGVSTFQSRLKEQIDRVKAEMRCQLDDQQSRYEKALKVEQEKSRRVMEENKILRRALAAKKG